MWRDLRIPGDHILVTWLTSGPANSWRTCGAHRKMWKALQSPQIAPHEVSSTEITLGQGSVSLKLAIFAMCVAALRHVLSPLTISPLLV